MNALAFAPTVETYSTYADPAFWRELFPELTLGALTEQDVATCPAEDTLDLMYRQLSQEGYMQGKNEQLVPLAQQLSAAISRCIELGIPPVFLYVFDQPWMCFHHLRPVIAGALGENYAALPDFWAWHVDPKKGESGWRPHRDKADNAGLASNGSPISLTVWVPLTEATPLNGCIYILPANRDPYYGTKECSRLCMDLPFYRALPVKPGEFLSWNQEVLHYGACSSPYGTHPRMSIAMEFQRGDVMPLNRPLMPPLANLPFEMRLHLICKQALQYKHMYALTPELEAFCHRVMAS